MKYLLLILLLSACGGSSTSDNTISEPLQTTYIVAGQSNAVNCDWSYFEDLTGAKTVNIANGGKGIEFLLTDYNKLNLLNGIKAKAILFVHGEFDSKYQTENYTGLVEQYRNKLGGLPLLISTVGYFIKGGEEVYPNSRFDALRDNVLSEIEVNNSWLLAFNDAQMFPEWGMLEQDGIHFNTDGCIMMMDAMAEATYNL